MLNKKFTVRGVDMELMISPCKDIPISYMRSTKRIRTLIRIYHDKYGTFKATLYMPYTSYTRKEYEKMIDSDGKYTSSGFIELVKDGVKRTWDTLMTYKNE